MFILEITAALATLFCVYLTGKQNILCWLLGIISAGTLMVIYLYDGLIGQAILQTIFAIQCAYGWYNWDSEDNLKINELDINKIITHLLVAMGVGLLIGTIMGCFNKSDQCFDWIAASIGLLGNMYLTKKIIQAWILFMIFNILVILLLLTQGSYILIALNVILFIISINGYLLWKKDLKTV